MAEHEPSIGVTSEWFTPPEYFEGGSANEIKRLMQEHQFVSNNCPINVYG